jgi:hypothetical protein
VWYTDALEFYGAAVRGFRETAERLAVGGDEA